MTVDILGLVPARGGSKGIPGKNIRLLAGKPLISYTIEAARQSRLLSRVIATTDSPAIAEIARTSGAEIPFLRPAEFAQDETPMAATVRHTLDWLGEHEAYHPEIVVLLQPTAPLRIAIHIDEAIALLQKSSADSLVSVTPVPGHYHPTWQFLVESGELLAFSGESFQNLPTRRQSLSSTYTRNGAIYAFYHQTFEQYGNFYGQHCLAYVMPEEVSVNIDTEGDWQATETALAQKKESPRNTFTEPPITL